MRVRFAKLAVLAMLLVALSAGPARAARKAVLLVSYVGVGTTYTLGVESEIEQGPPTLAAYFGTYQARVSWHMNGVIPVAFRRIIGSRRFVIVQRGPARWTSANSNGRISVDGLVGCPLGNACPTPTSPGQHPPCTTDALSMYKPWTRSLGGGRLDTNFHAIQLHLPLDANAVVTPAGNSCANFPGGTSNVGPIAFKPPLALNGGPQPTFPGRKLRAYQHALAPLIPLPLSKSLKLTKTSFNSDFEWSWKAIGNQIGNPAIPAIGQYFTNSITITSHVGVSLTH